MSTTPFQSNTRLDTCHGCGVVITKTLPNGDKVVPIIWGNFNNLLIFEGHVGGYRDRDACHACGEELFKPDPDHPDDFKCRLYPVIWSDGRILVNFIEKLGSDGVDIKSYGTIRDLIMKAVDISKLNGTFTDISWSR